MTKIETELRKLSAVTAPASVNNAVMARAKEDGLIDAAYAIVDSPIGRLGAVGTPRGLIALQFGISGMDQLLERIARTVSPRIVESPVYLDDVRRELDEYFEGDRTDFDIPIDWRLMDGFRRRVLRATARIPYGKVSTYRQIATKAGNPKASRATGNALGSNPIPIVVPCHRVLRTGGGLGGYGGGLEIKEFLLNLEGALA